MSKHQNGNKEAKKPKQDRSPTTTVPTPATLQAKPLTLPDRQKKR